jgi:hypothetical protein
VVQKATQVVLVVVVCSRTSQQRQQWHVFSPCNLVTSPKFSAFWAFFGSRPRGPYWLPSLSLSSRSALIGATKSRAASRSLRIVAKQQ